MLRTAHSYELAQSTGRVGERAQQVEDRPHSEGAAHTGDLSGGGVVQRGEHESHAHLVDAGGHFHRPQVYAYAERLQHVGRPAQ